MAPRRPYSTSLRGFGSVPAFLQLPREIRDYIYEMLLTTAWTFNYIDGETDYCMYRPVFRQSPAILFVNKQISEEARRIFYTKNEFIVLRLLGSRAQGMQDYIGESLHLPTLTILHHRDLVEPMLTVTIQSLSEETVTIRSLFQEEGHDDWEEEEFTLVTTTQAIHNIIQQFWKYISKGTPRLPQFDETLHLTLHLNNKNPSRRSYLHEHILKPWDQIQGFKKISLTGDLDQGLARHLEEYMVTGPRPDDYVRYVKLYRTLAEKYQECKLYCHAGWFWSHLHSYWRYHFYNRWNMTTGGPRDLFKHDFDSNQLTVQPTIMKMMLEKMKVSLHLPNYDNALWGVLDANEWIKAEHYVDHFGLDQRGVLVAKAQILLCSCLVSIGMEVMNDTVVKDLKTAARTFAKGNAQPQQGSKDVYDKLCWAVDNYFIDLDSPLRYTQKKWLNSRNHTDKEVPREGWPTFWEWMDVPVWSE